MEELGGSSHHSVRVSLVAQGVLGWVLRPVSQPGIKEIDCSDYAAV